MCVCVCVCLSMCYTDTAVVCRAKGTEIPTPAKVTEDVFHWASNPSEDQRALLTSACTLLCLSDSLKEPWSRGSGVATHTAKVAWRREALSVRPSVPDIPTGFHSHTFRESLSMQRLFGALKTIVNVVGLQLFKNSLRQQPLMGVIKIFLVLNCTWSFITVYCVLGSAGLVQPTTLHHT